MTNEEIDKLDSDLTECIAYYRTSGKGGPLSLLTEAVEAIRELRARLPIPPTPDRGGVHRNPIGEQIIHRIVEGRLMRMECPDAPDSGCMGIWSPAAAEQIEAIIADYLLAGDLTHMVEPDKAITDLEADDGRR